MDIKKILFALAVFTLLIGSACAASVNDFKVDSSFSSDAFTSDYYTVHLNADGDSGVAIYKNVDDDVYDDLNDDVVDNIVHGDGREYLVVDDDMQITKNADGTANFTDFDHAEHGVVEVVENGGEQYIVTFFAKDSSSTTNADLMSMLNNFNKDNDVAPVAF